MDFLEEFFPDLDEGAFFEAETPLEEPMKEAQWLDLPFLISEHSKKVAEDRRNWCWLDEGHSSINNIGILDDRSCGRTRQALGPPTPAALGEEMSRRPTFGLRRALWIDSHCINHEDKDKDRRKFWIQEDTLEYAKKMKIVVAYFKELDSRKSYFRYGRSRPVIKSTREDTGRFEDSTTIQKFAEQGKRERINRHGLWENVRFGNTDNEPSGVLEAEQKDSLHPRMTWTGTTSDSLWNPREYFLKVFQIRMDKVANEWETRWNKIETKTPRYIYLHHQSSHNC